MSTKVTIVGAGVIGCTLADELTRRGAEVTILDEAEIASRTSSATFAWINANDKAPHNYGALNFLGLQAHERAAARGANWFHQTGMIQVAHSPENAASLEENVDRVDFEGYGAHLVSRSDVLELEPALSPSGIVGGAFYPREGWIDVQTMCHSLIAQAVARGAQFAPFERVTSIDGTKVATQHISGEKREHTGDVVVLAAGNGTKKILAQSGVDFPVVDPNAEDSETSRDTAVGVITTTGPVNSGLKHFIRAEGIALRPARNGGVTFADHPTGGRWAKTDPELWTIPNILLERAQKLVPSLSSAAAETVAVGTRVLPEDGLTIADWLDDSQNVYTIATHSGVTLSAYLAESVADEILLGNRHSALAEFGLSRFASA